MTGEETVEIETPDNGDDSLLDDYLDGVRWTLSILNDVAAWAFAGFAVIALGTVILVGPIALGAYVLATNAAGPVSASVAFVVVLLGFAFVTGPVIHFVAEHGKEESHE